MEQSCLTRRDLRSWVARNRIGAVVDHLHRSAGRPWFLVSSLLGVGQVVIAIAADNHGSYLRATTTVGPAGPAPQADFDIGEVRLGEPGAILALAIGLAAVMDAEEEF